MVCNENEIGKNEDPSLITPLERVHDKNPNKESKIYKLLGVYFDECLSFKNHINLICNKINQSLYCINHAKNFLTKKALKSLYFAVIHPRILYCISMYSCTTTSNFKRLGPAGGNNFFFSILARPPHYNLAVGVDINHLQQESFISSILIQAL